MQPTFQEEVSILFLAMHLSERKKKKQKQKRNTRSCVALNRSGDLVRADVNTKLEKVDTIGSIFRSI